MMPPEKIAEDFVSDCERILNKKLVYTIFGSVRFKKYVEKKSDIDILILADRGFILPKEWLKIIGLMDDYGRKYWKVRKKKRMVSVIDIMIIIYPKPQLKIRRKLRKMKELKYTITK
jgi:predicted nucleotidyltransferase